MAGRIPREFIDQLLARVDIVELIDGRVKLKKAGRNYNACCPFHNEKSPSFTVAQDKQFYHCFGCGAHGNAIDFIMEYDRLEFPDAVEELASQAGLEVVREQSNYSSNGSGGNAPRSAPPSNSAKFTDHYSLMQWSAQYFQQALRQHPEKQRVIDYIRSRGLDESIVSKFGIGFAPPGWDNLLGQQRGNNSGQKLLTDCGMVIEKEDGKRYDRFRDRLMFPIHDRRGRVVGFGGRVMGDDTPKYLNSPETPIFHKGHELYGLYEVRQASRNPERVLVVEGYMDVVALAQHGIDYAVASLGTATTAEHIQALIRTAKSEVVCCYDGDRAGREAAWRALETALPLLRSGTALKFMFLPDGEDPDTLVRQEGQEAFEQRISNASSLSDYLFSQLTKQADLSNEEGKGHLAKLTRDLINKVNDEDLRLAFANRLAQVLSWHDHKLEQFLKREAKPAQLALKKTSKGRGTPLRHAITLLLHQPQLGHQLQRQTALAHLNLNGVALLSEMLEFCRQQPLTTAQLLERFRERPEHGVLRKLMGQKLAVEENLGSEFTDCLSWLNQRFLEQMFETLNQKARDGSITKDELRQLQWLTKELVSA
ncbi:DNA primase [Ferrimonas lipolytica]|uniref:DNA primase n=1 Tax=Ferrimonas lipolytica TaxID=2724191 RepID=A0A6H1UGN0_9GAMM|nr:DNA primase [Ferrimonas lipolytica]QIZ77760.1 DNA primase [Ferrimonas lipolytica]